MTHMQMDGESLISLTEIVVEDGTVLRVHASGDGPPMVMLHGWTADHREWDMFTRELSRHHRVYCWDARGHGDGSVPSALPTLARMAADLEALCAHFDLRKVSLVGHSMGALTAWEYLRQFGPGRLARLCLIDQSPRLQTDAGWHLGIYGDFDVARAAQFAQDLQQDFVETVLRLSAHGLNAKARKGFEQNTRGWQRERARLQQLAPAPLIAAWDDLVQADYRALLPQIALPTLLIFGDESNFYPLPAAHYVQVGMPNATLRIYEQTDHNPHLWQPGRFTGDLLAFTGG